MEEQKYAVGNIKFNKTAEDERYAMLIVTSLLIVNSKIWWSMMEIMLL